MDNKAPLKESREGPWHEKGKQFLVEWLYSILQLSHFPVIYMHYEADLVRFSS